MSRAWTWALALTACAPLPSGTFVGNPEMNVRLADTPVQVVSGGVFDAFELHLTGCARPLVELGPVALTFEGDTADHEIELEVGEHCGLFFVVNRLEVRFGDGTSDYTLVADNFDLSVEAGFEARMGDQFLLRFGDETWLAELAALAEPGLTVLNGEFPELDTAFYEGLTRGSELLEVQQ